MLVFVKQQGKNTVHLSVWKSPSEYPWRSLWRRDYSRLEISLAYGLQCSLISEPLLVAEKRARSASSHQYGSPVLPEGIFPSAKEMLEKLINKNQFMTSLIL